ncbi:AAA family ATPase [Salmonirosea aquatica]|uniref:AAA family ATPase n=1 Tax=Salmonirosea aquatica TaxID=2654236 RepID=A0A7C9BF64_9BACT|nr:AAA family ATPase [Cytophagaceae bacterium SJW1-29]
MFLKNITIRNFKGLNLSLSFKSDKTNVRATTVILGENGVGKSNFLKAIALVTSGSEVLAELLGRVDDWISYGEDICEIHAVLSTKDKEVRDVSLKLKRGDTIKDVITHNLESLNLIDGALAHSNRNYFVIGYGASRRLYEGNEMAGSVEAQYRNSRAKNVATLFNANALLHPLSAWVMSLDYRSDGRALALVEDVLNDLLVGVRFKKINKSDGMLLFQVGRKTVPLPLLSEGYQGVLAWVGDLLFRITNTFGDYRSPLNTHGLLLVDEIELHLHPSWQRNLLRYVRAKFPNLQIVTSTHSVFTAQQTEEGELYTLVEGDRGDFDLLPFRGKPNELLVSQLLMSSAFGLTTDESVRVQEVKSEYREMMRRKSISVPDEVSASDEKRMDTLAATLERLPTTRRTNMGMEPGQMDLIQEVRDELRKRSKK